MNNKSAIEKLQEAWQLATLLHSGQTYGSPNKGERIEYINHIGSVVFEVSHAFKHESMPQEELGILCAVLHDTIEDTEATFESIRDQFGNEVAAGVLALTKNEELETKELQMMDSLERIKKQPQEVWVVKMADRICNLYAPPHYWNNEKKEKYIDEALLIHSHLKDGNAYLAQRLLEKIERYNEFIVR
ncbi:HD domain-containing protein [Fluviicola sp.]|uniref:HD domain-containing protein n=1 Tax=Fluviicola sp. TaxID=1917219 RepID=UPI0031DC391A